MGTATRHELELIERQPARDEGRTPVLFVHGLGHGAWCWEHWQAAAAEAGYPAYAVSLRGHGTSAGRLRTALLSHYVDDVVATASALPGPVVLVGHSMGGMSIVALAEERPELFGDKVVGVALISTTAGGLDPHRVLVPALPSTLGSTLALRGVAFLARGHRTVDVLRRASRVVATVATDLFAFGDDVPESYVKFVDSMLSQTPFEVIAEFFPGFGSLDKFETVEALGTVPVAVVCGTEDRMTSIGHSRKLRSRIPGATLLECEGAGHMVILERHEQVNAALDQLLAAAGERVGR
jgi:pimeloyl-ACP methyl ester carboxylesterase